MSMETKYSEQETPHRVQAALARILDYTQGEQSEFPTKVLNELQDVWEHHSIKAQPTQEGERERCDCSKHKNKVCDICQGLSKPWRKVVYPSGPWKLRWYGSGEDRGYHIFDHSAGGHNGDRVAFLGDRISSDDAGDIVWAHNVAALSTRSGEVELQKQLDEEDRNHSQTIDERDEAQDRLSEIALRVGEFFDVPVGEWSSCNDPAEIAMEILDGGFKSDIYDCATGRGLAVSDAASIREKALREAAASICEFCKHRPDEPATYRNGVWVHIDPPYEREDGSTFDASPTCCAQAIHDLICDTLLSTPSQESATEPMEDTKGGE